MTIDCYDKNRTDRNNSDHCAPGQWDPSKNPKCNWVRSWVYWQYLEDKIKEKVKAKAENDANANSKDANVSTLRNSVLDPLWNEGTKDCGDKASGWLRQNIDEKICSIKGLQYTAANSNQAFVSLYDDYYNAKRNQLDTENRAAEEATRQTNTAKDFTDNLLTSLINSKLDEGISQKVLYSPAELKSLWYNNYYINNPSNSESKVKADTKIQTGYDLKKKVITDAVNPFTVEICAFNQALPDLPSGEAWTATKKHPNTTAECTAAQSKYCKEKPEAWNPTAGDGYKATQCKALWEKYTNLKPTELSFGNLCRPLSTDIFSTTEGCGVACSAFQTNCDTYKNTLCQMPSNWTDPNTFSEKCITFWANSPPVGQFSNICNNNEFLPDSTKGCGKLATKYPAEVVIPIIKSYCLSSDVPWKNNDYAKRCSELFANNFPVDTSKTGCSTNATILTNNVGCGNLCSLSPTWCANARKEYCRNSSLTAEILGNEGCGALYSTEKDMIIEKRVTFCSQSNNSDPRCSEWPTAVGFLNLAGEYYGTTIPLWIADTIKTTGKFTISNGVNLAEMITLTGFEATIRNYALYEYYKKDPAFNTTLANIQLKAKTSIYKDLLDIFQNSGIIPPKFPLNTSEYKGSTIAFGGIDLPQLSYQAASSEPPQSTFSVSEKVNAIDGPDLWTAELEAEYKSLLNPLTPDMDIPEPPIGGDWLCIIQNRYNTQEECYSRKDALRQMYEHHNKLISS